MATGRFFNQDGSFSETFDVPDADVNPAVVSETLQQKLDKLSVYELRAVYYLCRAAMESQCDADLLARTDIAIAELLGGLSIEQWIELYPALMRQLAQKDPDIVARQAINEAYPVVAKLNTEGRVQP